MHRTTRSDEGGGRSDDGGSRAKVRARGSGGGGGHEFPAGQSGGWR